MKILSLAAGTGGLTAAGLPWRAWTSDLSAGIGQTRVATLDDGSLLTLNTGSAADVRFSDALRLIVLRQGELHIATYRDAMTPARPGRGHADGSRARVGHPLLGAPARRPRPGGGE